MHLIIQNRSPAKFTCANWQFIIINLTGFMWGEKGAWSEQGFVRQNHNELNTVQPIHNLNTFPGVLTLLLLLLAC